MTVTTTACKTSSRVPLIDAKRGPARQRRTRMGFFMPHFFPGNDTKKVERFTAVNSALVLVDHQVGTMNLIKNIDREQAAKQSIALSA